jgi:hypothetical protein
VSASVSQPLPTAPPAPSNPLARRNERLGPTPLEEEHSRKARTGDVPAAGVEPRTSTLWVDGSNVCRNWPLPNQPNLAVLLTLLCELIRKGRPFLCLFDANIRYVLADHSPGDTKMYLKLISDYPEQFTEVPGKSVADDFLLKRASTSGGKVVSNDQFRQLIPAYPWLAPPSERLIKGAIVGANI